MAETIKPGDIKGPVRVIVQEEIQGKTLVTRITSSPENPGNLQGRRVRLEPIKVVNIKIESGELTALEYRNGLPTEFKHAPFVWSNILRLKPEEANAYLMGDAEWSSDGATKYDVFLPITYCKITDDNANL